MPQFASIARISSTISFQFLNIIFYAFLCLFSTQFFAQSTPVDVGYRTFNYGSAPYNEATAFKPESKMWWNDNFWWACMFNRSAGEFRIHRFDIAGSNWSSTSTAIDDRPFTTADALWDEAANKLYIVSHIVAENAGDTAAVGDEGRLYRYSYNAGTNTYSLDTNFPVNVNNSVSETLVIDKDSQGKLWVTWTQLGKVMVNHSADDGLTWGTPFILPIQGNDIRPDDISSVRAFETGELGIMWSNQNDKKIYFAVHNDLDNFDDWGSLFDRETALSAPSGQIADDHININMACDGTGTVYAVTKTSLDADDQPLIMLLKRTPAGVWTEHTVALGGPQHTRPTIMVDGDNEQIYVFASGKVDEQRGIYYKVSDLDNISFPGGIGTVFILSEDDNDIDNPTSTKQCIGAETGLPMLASCKNTKFYLHNYMELSAAPIISNFSPDNGAEGTGVVISGRNFTGATGVEFHDVSASFTVDADTQITTSVPVGATSGSISVINSTDTTFSDSSFTVDLPPYTLTTNVIGNGSIFLDPPGGSYGSVMDVEVTAVPDAGYIFTGWGGDLSGSANPDTVTMNGDRSVTATFVPESALPITHEETQTGSDSESSSVSTSSALSPGSSQLYLAAISTRSHITVSSVSGLGLSWTLIDEQCGGRNQTGVEVWAAQGSPSGSGIVTANFSGSPNNAVIAVSRYSGVSSVTPTGTVMTVNTNGTEGDCNDGSDSNSYNFTLSTSLSGTVIYNATALRAKSHTPGSGYTEHSEISEGSGGDKVGIAVQDRSLVTEAVETVDGSFNGNTDWAVIAMELVPAAGASTPQYDLATNVSGNGSIQLNPAGGTYDSATVVTLTAIPDAGYAFDGWSGDLSSTANPDSLTIDMNKTVTATFSTIPPIQYNVVVNISGNGNVSLNPAGGAYDAGTEVILTATPDSANRFVNWSGDLSIAVTPDTIVVDSNMVISANFIRQFSLATATTGNGNIGLSPTGGLYDSATVVTVTATADAGSEFSGWSGDLGGSDNPESLVMNSDKAVTANFTLLPPTQFSVTLNISGNGSVSLNPSGGTYDAGTQVILSATPDSANRFVNWSGDFSGTITPDTIIVDSNMVISANFIRQFFLFTSTDGNGNINLSPTGDLYDSATVIMLTAQPNAGYTFANWSGDLSGTSNPESITMDSDQSISAAFTESVAGNLMLEEIETGSAQESDTVATAALLTAATDHLYLASISMRRAESVQSVSGLGLSWSRVVQQCAGRSQTSAEVWMAIGAPGGDGIVTATLENQSDNIVIAVARYSGVNSADPIGISFSGNTNGDSGTCSGGTDSNQYGFNLTPEAGNSIIFGAIAPRHRAHTPGAAYSEHVEISEGSGGDKIGLAIVDRQLSSAALDSLYGSFDNNTDWAVIGVEIKAGAAAVPLIVNAKCFLSGAYASGKMGIDLKENGLLPLSQPFTDASWQHSGSESVSAIPDSVVDWVLVKLRSDTSAASAIASRAAFLKNDGTLIDTSGNEGVTFTGIVSGNYYIVIQHRNHLAIMSNTPQSLDHASSQYDFTTAQAQAYGTTPMTEITSGIFGLIPGDSNSDGSIDASDKNAFWRAFNGTLWQYTKKADFNLDGDIDASDLNVYWRNHNGSATQVPD